MKEILGATATVIAFCSYIPYFRNIFRGLTKPHAFSWLIWSILTGIGFAAQVYDDGGPGAWATGFTAGMCFVVFLVALKSGEKDITNSDWLCLSGAFIAIGLWAVTSNPLTSVILITLIDALGFIPTFRKSFHKPHQETALTYGLSALKFMFAIPALSNITLVTTLYPASLIVMNGLFVMMLLIRRKQIV